MPPGPKFWRGFRTVALVGLVIAIVGAIVCFAILRGWMQTYFGILCLILAANFGLMLFFIGHNDPSKKGDPREDNK